MMLIILEVVQNENLFFIIKINNIIFRIVLKLIKTIVKYIFIVTSIRWKYTVLHLHWNSELNQSCLGQQKGTLASGIKYILSFFRFIALKFRSCVVHRCVYFLWVAVLQDKHLRPVFSCLFLLKTEYFILFWQI